MRKLNGFQISAKPYAIDLSTVIVEKYEERDGLYFLWGSCSAVWFRRHNRTLRACIGTLSLWGQYMREPVDISTPRGVLVGQLDGRYGGDCGGRWDGQNYWGAQDLTVMEEHLNVLKPMLEFFPEVPFGYDGWWSFR